ncbi:hypothetical protein ABT063_45995 [Streptomyces sp. NPDC002838]|uniref:hypothetical protein n=1 Tax=Streptomyces sp. NPDC002838 TaxID=3154436 RepID=UPI003318E31A
MDRVDAHRSAGAGRERGGTWGKVMREQGRREGGPHGYDGIRRYLSTLQPTLTASGPRRPA